MSKNGMPNFAKTSGYVNLTRLPTPKSEYTVNFDKLTGGLNLYAPDYELKLNESPEMENMLWKNGALCSRLGQSYVDSRSNLPYLRTTKYSGDGVETSFVLPDTDSLDFQGIFAVRVDGMVKTSGWSFSGDTITFDTAPSAGTDNVVVVLSFKAEFGYTCTDELFWDYAFFHIGDKLWYAKPGKNMVLTALCDLKDMHHFPTGMTFTPERGTFFRYGDFLYYKSRCVFVQIMFNGFESDPVFSAGDVVSFVYEPITYINCDWKTGAGDQYQPENRLAHGFYLMYNAGTDEQTQKFSGDGATTQFQITLSDFVYVTDVVVDHASVGNWSVSGSYLNFYTAPAAGTNNIEVKCQCAVKTYQFPAGLTIDWLAVDGYLKHSPADYTYDDTTGLLTFTSAPTVHVPAQSNTISARLTYTDNDAFYSIMDCPYAVVYGGNQNLCVVVGGSRAQPNAFFWNGNDSGGMNITYWPFEQYNFGGDTEDAITGFGKQQGNLVVFKNRSIGKVSMSFTTVDMSGASTARTYIEMDYTSINSKTGCDLPWTIQLIDNNLVFCNTEQGVHIIRDSSAAYENNIECISTKVNGNRFMNGLLWEVRKAGNVSSFDDTKRYWIIADNKVYCWDYELSPYKDPSWFYLTGINAVSLFMDSDYTYHLGPTGRLTRFDSTYADYGEGFKRKYRYATQYFRTYDRLKTVTGAIFSFRADTDLNASITYKSDYETRKDLTDVVCHTWHLSPRDLSYRDLSVAAPFAYVAKRRPGCRHIRHFSMTLTSDKAGVDMPLIGAQVFYKYEGRER